MSSRVRLLPALIGAASVLLVLRVGAIAAANNPAPTAATPAAPAPVLPATPAAATPATAPGAAPATPALSQPASAPAGQAQSKGEAEVLQNLGQRRAELDARERDLDLREQLLSATEQRVQEHLVELQALQGKLDTMLAQRDAAEEAQIASLVKTYENMKAPDAAKIFNKLDHEVLLTVAQRMKPAKIGAVMAAMDPARAQDLTVMLAKRMSLPKPQPVAAAAPTVPTAPPVAETQPPAAAVPPTVPRG
jgi:flagellar motility protein MotE (MotC chaperone)